MLRRFSKHYTREEAEALLPEIRRWLSYLRAINQAIASSDERIAAMLGQGNDIGGDFINKYWRTQGALRRFVAEFSSREIQVKDLQRGLIDFPGLIHGREVFLCWEEGEDRIEFWHDIESGYAGRERIE